MGAPASTEGKYLFPPRRTLPDPSRCNEDEPHTPTPSFPRRACPVLDTGETFAQPSFPRRACPREGGGGNPSPVAATGHVGTESPAPMSIPLCGRGRAIVIPAKSLPRTRYGSVSKLVLRSRAEPAPAKAGAGTHPRSLPPIMWQRRIPRPCPSPYVAVAGP